MAAKIGNEVRLSKEAYDKLVAAANANQAAQQTAESQPAPVTQNPEPEVHMEQNQEPQDAVVQPDDCMIDAEPCNPAPTSVGRHYHAWRAERDSVAADWWNAAADASPFGGTLCRFIADRCTAQARHHFRGGLFSGLF